MGIKKLGHLKYRVLWTDETSAEHRKIVHGTKEAAEEYLVEQKLRVQRIKAGFEVRERNPQKLLVKDVAKKLRLARNVPQFTQLVVDYIEDTPLGEERLDRVTTPMLRVHLAGLTSKAWRNEQARIAASEKPRRVQPAKKLGPETLNHVRTALIAIFKHAIEHGELVGNNPAPAVKKQKPPKYTFETLTVDEVTRLLNVAEMPYSAMIAGSLLALRKGELFGLDVVDVDVERWELHVQRSHDKNTTKSGKARVVPIHPSLRPFFVAAIEASEGGVLFPGRKKDGKVQRRHRNAKLSHVLDKYLAAAGVTRHLRWHDLRHTAATLMLQAGAPVQHVSRVLGHSSIAITVDRYGHLITEDLRTAIERVPLKIEPKAVFK